MVMSYLRINSIMENPSLCDGPGYRTVLFLQGCNLKCNGCQNPSTWDVNNGRKVEIKALASDLRKKCFNKKLTISGGEPLLQKESLIELFEELKDFDLCLYTGHEYEEVPPEILKYLKYIKVGPFKKELKTTIVPYLGSTNQKLIEVKHDEISK